MSSEQPSDPAPVCPGCQAEGALALPCGHWMCQSCLQQCQHELGGGEGAGHGCTECYGRQLLNNVLKGLLDSIFEGQPRRTGQSDERERETEDEGQGETQEEGEGDLCPLHAERLSLFCTEDEELVCEDCRDDVHLEHSCSPTQEAAVKCKLELGSALSLLQEKLETLNLARRACQDAAAHIRRQSQRTVQIIKEDFEKLHQFLRDEEQTMMIAVKQEEEQKSQKMKERMDKFADEIASLSDTINEAEEAMGMDELPFLRNYKKTSDNIECTVQVPEELPDALVDVAKHLGCLKYRVWDKMHSVVQYTPIMLDPNTADLSLVVSDDLTSVRYTDEEQPLLPDNPERFCDYDCVLGSEGIDSGRHSWDVEVGDSTEWTLGVAWEGVARKEWLPLSPEHGFWTLSFRAGEYRAGTLSQAPLKLRKRPQRVRLQLDWDVGRLCFSDASDNTLLYRFKHRFRETVLPYFASTCKRQPLRILPGKVSILTD